MGPIIVVAIVFFGLFGLLRFLMGRHLQGQGYRPSRMPPSLEPDHTFDPQRSVSFRGGSRVGRGNASIPLVRLHFDESWAHLSGAGRSFGGVGPVWVDRSAVVGVRRVRAVLNPGLRFDTGDGRYDGVIFWTSDAAAVFGALRDHGWPVSDGSLDEADARP